MASSIIEDLIFLLLRIFCAMVLSPCAAVELLQFQASALHSEQDEGQRAKGFFLIEDLDFPCFCATLVRISLLPNSQSDPPTAQNTYDGFTPISGIQTPLKDIGI